MATKRIEKSYDNEYKAQAVKLAQEIGGHKAANELGIPKGTMYTWIKAFKEGRLCANEAVHTPNNALSLNEELIELRKRVKEQDKEIRRSSLVPNLYTRFQSCNLVMLKKCL